MLMDFWSENEGMLAPKSNQTSMPTSKGVFLKKRVFTFAKTIRLKVLGVEVENKNRSTIDQKSINNLSTIQPQHSFLVLLMGFGKQVGVDSRAKSEKKFD